MPAGPPPEDATTVLSCTMQSEILTFDPLVPQSKMAIPEPNVLVLFDCAIISEIFKVARTDVFVTSCSNDSPPPSSSDKPFWMVRLAISTVAEEVLSMIMMDRTPPGAVWFVPPCRIVSVGSSVREEQFAFQPPVIDREWFVSTKKCPLGSLGTVKVPPISRKLLSGLLFGDITSRAPCKSAARSLVSLTQRKRLPWSNAKDWPVSKSEAVTVSSSEKKFFSLKPLGEEM
jgi:hypothetical protein